jgi:MazG family protein
VARALPALVRAEKLQKRAAKVGFDWQAVDGVLAKVREELNEIEEELTSGAEPSRLQDEVGDLLFSCVNLARHLTVDAESSLRQANAKFEGRFREMEALAHRQGRSVPDLDSDTLGRLWEEVKQEGAGCVKS